MSEAEENPYWDMIHAISVVGPYFESKEEVNERYPEHNMRVVYRMEYVVETPEAGREDDGIGAWTIGLGPLMQAYLAARVEERSLNEDIELAQAQAAIREHMFRFCMMQQMQADPESVFILPMEEEGE